VPAHSPSSETSSSIGRVRPHHPGRRLHQRTDGQRSRRQRNSGREGGPRTRHSTPPRVSAVAPAWPRVPTPRPCCSHSAKVTHLNALPQGQPERDERTLNMVAAMRSEAFGSCSNTAECEAVCPKGIPLEFIARLNRDLRRGGVPSASGVAGRPRRAASPGARGRVGVMSAIARHAPTRGRRGQARRHVLTGPGRAHRVQRHHRRVWSCRGRRWPPGVHHDGVVRDRTILTS